MLVVCLVVQAGGGGGLDGRMGGGVSTAMFGGQGADKLMTRMTTGLAAAFMVLALLISIVGNPQGTAEDSVVRQRALQRETAKLIEAAGSREKGAFGAQLKKTGKTCGSCHKKFRKPKKESYNRKKM